MKKYILLGIVVFAMFLVQPVWARTQRTLTEQVNEENVFNKMSDYFTTLGKSDVNTAAIKRQRHEQRRLNRLKSLRHKKEQAERRRFEDLSK